MVRPSRSPSLSASTSCPLAPRRHNPRVFTADTEVLEERRLGGIRPPADARERPRAADDRMGGAGFGGGLARSHVRGIAEGKRWGRVRVQFRRRVPCVEIQRRRRPCTGATALGINITPEFERSGAAAARPGARSGWSRVREHPSDHTPSAQCCSSEFRIASVRPAKFQAVRSVGWRVSRWPRERIDGRVPRRLNDGRAPPPPERRAALLAVLSRTRKLKKIDSGSPQKKLRAPLFSVTLCEFGGFVAAACLL